MRTIGETLTVAARLGFDLTKQFNVEQVASRARRRGMRPSTFQDVLAGKSLQIDAPLGQTLAAGRDLNVPTPVIDTRYDLMRGRDQSLQVQ